MHKTARTDIRFTTTVHTIYKSDKIHRYNVVGNTQCDSELPEISVLTYPPVVVQHAADQEDHQTSDQCDARS